MSKRPPPPSSISPSNNKASHHDPLSADAMDAFRCPTRVDFLNAASCGDPVDKLAPSQPRTAFTPRVASLRPRQQSTTSTYSSSISRTRSKSRTLRTSRITDDEHSDSSKSHSHKEKDRSLDTNHPTSINSNPNDSHNHSSSINHINFYDSDTTTNTNTFNQDSEDEDDFVPSQLMDSLLDAMDHVSSDTELRAISQWLDRLRIRAGYTVKLTDADLSNGVALLDALVVAGALDDEHEGMIQRRPDIDGHVATANTTVIRNVLASFPWRTPPPVSMDEIDVWKLPRFVLLAAVSCDCADDLVADMMDCDEWVQRRLSETVAEGMRDMGLATPEEEEQEQIEKVKDLEEQMQKQIERAERAEADAVRLESALDGWRATCEALEETVQTLTARLEQAQKDVKKLKEREKERRRIKDREDPSTSANVNGNAVVLKERNRSAAAAARLTTRSVPSSPARTLHRKDSRMEDFRSRRRADSTR